MITRFAPSPTGYLHLGHAFSALTAARLAIQSQGSFLLRIEDIDRPRCRPEFEQAIFEDLTWIGLSWPKPVMRQSDRFPAYETAIRSLSDRGLLYACDCTRKDIAQAASAPQEGVDGPRYPGTCRARDIPLDQPNTSLRLNIEKALDSIDSIQFADGEARSLDRQSLSRSLDDIVIARKEIGTSYHLAVVVDDAAQAVTDVVRGADLEPATPIQVLLQRLLDLPTPQYHHHPLIRDASGQRLAKRDDARSIRSYRESGLDVEEVIALINQAAPNEYRPFSRSELSSMVV